MNLPHAAVRNRLAVTTLSDLLTISINGLGLRVWNVDKYVLSWLKTGRHGALNKPTGKSSSPKEPKRERKLLSYLINAHKSRPRIFYRLIIVVYS